MTFYLANVPRDLPPVQDDISTSVQFVCTKFPDCLRIAAAWLVTPHCTQVVYFFLSDTECCRVLSSALLPPYMPLLCLVELGLFLPSSCLFQCSPGLHFMCHLRKYSLYSPIHKSNSKNRSLSCRTTLNAALPFDRELLLPTFQLEFSSGLHPFHLHHALLACLSECHIKRIEKVKL